MIQIKNISLSFGHQTVFDDINLTIQDDNKIGLVGLNGSGKSTLLKAIAGGLQLDEGSININGSKKLAYMPQHVVLESNKTILDETLTGNTQIWALLKEQRTLENSINDDAAGIRLAEVTMQLHELEAHQYEIDTKKTLLGLGFTEHQLAKPVSNLSVGWKMRIVLAKLLLKKADFYLFDEPTNHLDIIAKDWFLSFLKQASFGFLLVCHERYFLNQLCSEIIELEFGNGTRYQGNYTEYEEQKEANLKELEQAAKQQQKEIKRKQATIQRFRAKANKARMAKSMQRALDKVELIELPPSAKSIRITLPSPKQRAGKIVLTVKNVSHAFDNHSIFKNASFTIGRAERIALIAPNGVGKTTLFNIITQHYKLQNGSIEFGYNVDPIIFHQDQDSWLTKTNSVLEEVLSSAPPGKTPEQARTLLGCFLFSYKDIDKKIGVLSGGEKNRVSMVKVLLQDANFLLLDEPTNHLDIPSKDILLKALNQYQGTILFVSHDHDFINQLATHVIALDANGTKTYHGNYKDYLAQTDALNETKTVKKDKPLSAEGNTVTQNKKPDYEQQKTIKKLERKIGQIEKNIQKVQNAFANLDYGTPEFDQNNKKLHELTKEFELSFSAWEQLQQENKNDV